MASERISWIYFKKSWFHWVFLIGVFCLFYKFRKWKSQQEKNAASIDLKKKNCLKNPHKTLNTLFVIMCSMYIISCQKNKSVRHNLYFEKVASYNQLCAVLVQQKTSYFAGRRTLCPYFSVNGIYLQKRHVFETNMYQKGHLHVV